MALKETILSRRETIRLGSRGDLERWIVFEYSLSDGDRAFGPFTFETPKKGFSYDMLRADIDKEKKGLEPFLKE